MLVLAAILGQLHDLVDERHGRRGRSPPRLCCVVAQLGRYPYIPELVLLLPLPSYLRNGAWPRWRAEETLRNGARVGHPCFLNARD